MDGPGEGSCMNPCIERAASWLSELLLRLLLLWRMMRFRFGAAKGSDCSSRLSRRSGATCSGGLMPVGSEQAAGVLPVLRLWTLDMGSKLAEALFHGARCSAGLAPDSSSVHVASSISIVPLVMPGAPDLA